MNTKQNPPGWDAYMATLQSLGEGGRLGAIASAALVRAGKALAMAAFEAGADAMHAASAEAMRAEIAAEPVPGPATLRQMVAEGYGRGEPVQAAGGTCKGPGPCPHQDRLAGRLAADCCVCGGRDPLPF